MATFGQDDDLRGAEFVEADLRGARIVDTYLSGVVMRGVDVAGMEIDSPWLCKEGSSLLVNGVDIVPLVDAELDRRFPGRAQRRAADPVALQAAWEAVQHTWNHTLQRVAAMPDGTVDESVAGEWSVAQTLRHLVCATDIWLGLAVLAAEQPFHPLGLVFDHGESPAFAGAQFSTEVPTYEQVLEARAGRVAMVRDFLAEVTADELATPRRNPHDPGRAETTLSCLHTILEEEWEHHRYIARDLDVLDAAAGATG